MSLILLGILNSQVTAAGGGGMELIESTILTSSASSVTFSSIPQDYKHLQIRTTWRTDEATTTPGSEMLLNGDTGANYTFHWLYGNGSSVKSTAGTNKNYVRWMNGAGNNLTTGVFNAGTTDLLDYSSSSKNTTIRTLQGFTSSPYHRIYLRSASWMDTSAVTSLTIRTIGASTNFVAGSRFSLYGIRG